jgi:hypothetical protein
MLSGNHESATSSFTVTGSFAFKNHPEQGIVRVEITDSRNQAGTMIERVSGAEMTVVSIRGASPILLMIGCHVAKAPDFISPEEAAELQHLYSEFVAASQHAAQTLRAKGINSPDFREADRATGVIWRRLREILGTAGSHWMA